MGKKFQFKEIKNKKHSSPFHSSHRWDTIRGMVQHCSSMDEQHASCIEKQSRLLGWRGHIFFLIFFLSLSFSSVLVVLLETRFEQLKILASRTLSATTSRKIELVDEKKSNDITRLGCILYNLTSHVILIIYKWQVLISRWSKLTIRNRVETKGGSLFLI